MGNHTDKKLPSPGDLYSGKGFNSLPEEVDGVLVLASADNSGWVPAVGVVMDASRPKQYQPRSAWRITVSQEQLQAGEWLAQIEARELEEIWRTLILQDTEQFYQQGRAPQIQKPFTADRDPVNYGGRVYDHQEMVNLVDSALTFQLTGYHYDQSFCEKLAQKLNQGALPDVSVATVNSGSSANLLALTALTSHKLGEERLQPGDEVISVAAGFPTTVAPIFQNGLVPVFVDVGEGDHNIDPGQLQAALSPRTRAIFIAHALGFPFDLDAILAFAEKHDLWLIEDSCDALGAKYRLQRSYRLKRGRELSGEGWAGTFGDVGTTSFFPAHHITMGEGGAVFSPHGDLSAIVTSLRDWGRDCWCQPGRDNTCQGRFSKQFGDLPAGYDHKYVYSHLGFNLKITDMQAAVGVAQLDKLDRFVEARQKNWAHLKTRLAGLVHCFILPDHAQHVTPSPFGFTLIVRKGAGFTRQELTDFLEAKRIQTRPLFAGNLLRHPAITEDELTYRQIGNLPHTETVMNQSFWIGVYPGMKPGMIDFMADAIVSFVDARTNGSG